MDVASHSESVIACRRLTKVFKDFWMRDRARAVESLTMDVRAHEVFGLLGPNGSGKSTTIKVVLGLLRATSGAVLVFGKLPSDVATKRRIGYLPEESYLYPFLNARETLDYYAKLFELERRTRVRRIDELLDMVGLTSAQFRPVHEYSKGMQRRIGLAQALINDPDLLILDEPTTGLDPIGTRQVKDLILELGRRGKTVLLSSHLLADVEDVVDRMVILYGGRIRAEGTTDELLAKRSRTTIETDALDDATVAEIDRVVRARMGGEVIRVSHPHQKLEELFLGIVESARAEHLATSGVTHGGQTASFLRGEGGEELISSLVEAGDAEPSESAAPPEPAGREPEDDVLDSLVDSGASPAPEPVPASGGGAVRPAPPAARTQHPEHVEPAGESPDDDVIGSLLDDEDRP